MVFVRATKQNLTSPNCQGNGTQDTKGKIKMSGIDAAKAVFHMSHDIHALKKSLKAILAHYVQLASCGDCGNWNPEQEEIVIETRALIAKLDRKDK